MATFDGVIYETFQLACHARGLMSDDSELIANLEHDALSAQGAMPQPHMMVANSAPPSITTATLEHDALAAQGAMPQTAYDGGKSDTTIDHIRHSGAFGMRCTKCSDGRFVRQ